MKDKYYFISDIHLGIRNEIDNKTQEEILVRFLQEIKSDALELYIVGDLFDCWIEYRYVVPKGFYRVFSSLYDLVKSGTKVTYMCGNHDFWLGNYFKEEFEIDILSKPIELNINNKKFYIHHGDGLAYKDTGYRILKKILRNKVSQFFYSLLHPDFGIWLAKSTSSKSRGYTKVKDYSKKDGLKDFAINKIKDGYNFVIMGHRHKTSFIKQDSGIYINLGDWITNFTYGLFEGNKFSLNRFYDEKSNSFLPSDKREINQ
jgi:UDP-2,3-diacylglucosamine hydrolase